MTAEPSETHSQSTRTRTAASSITERTPNPANTLTIPGIMQTPGIPAQQMQHTGTRERACGSGTGQNPLAEHAHHAPQPRSIAWGEVQEKQRRTLLVRVFWKGSGNGSSDVVISPPEVGRLPARCAGRGSACRNSAQTCSRLAPAARRGPRRRLTRSSERAARSPAPLNPAGFEPRIPCVPDSGLVCRVCLSPT